MFESDQYKIYPQAAHLLNALWNEVSSQNSSRQTREKIKMIPEAAHKSFISCSILHPITGLQV